MVMKFFGWRVRADGRRKYRTLWLEIPRKNGKTTLLAWLILYLLFADGEKGAQIVCAASDTDQATIIFDICKSIVESSPKLLSKSKVYKRSIFVTSSRSVFRVISGTPKGKHGKNLHALCVDEVHEQEGRNLIDALKTSNIARRQPVELYATTAGDNMQSICGEMHEYALAVQQKRIKDETFLPMVYAADVDKWKDEAEWFKANPNLDVTFELSKMRERL
jgi:phage terminase large subunit-like protein